MLIDILQSVATPIPGAVLLGGLIGLPLALVYRNVRRAQLRRLLAVLSPQARGAVLLPLRMDPLGDTRRIVAPLLEEFADRTEVTPADAPTGRGDEPTP